MVGCWSRWTKSKKMGFGHGGRGGCTTAPCRTRSFAAGSFAATQGTVLTSVLLVCTEARRVTLLRLSKILTKRQKKRPSLSPLKNANHKEGRITWEAGRGGHHLPLADSCCDGPTRIEPAGGSGATFFLFFFYFRRSSTDQAGSTRHLRESLARVVSIAN